MPSLETVLLISAVFLLAGGVKGVAGLGFPTVAMGALGLAMPPAQAAAIMVVPCLITNIWQFAAGPAMGVIVRRLAPMMVLVCGGVALGIQFLTNSEARWASVALGAVLAAYAMVGLLGPRFVVARRHEPWLGPVVGVVTGVLTGATGVFAVPAVPYLSALALSREELIQALGLSFMVSTAALAVGLAASNSYRTETAVASALAIVPSLAGMYFGQRIRQRLDQELFRRWFLIAMLLVGCSIMARAV